MTIKFRLALAQINTTVGDLSGNAEKIKAAMAAAREAGADMAVFPELAVTGYPPEDLLIRPAFIRKCRETVNELAAQADGLNVLLGAPVGNGELYNCAAILGQGAWAGSVRKTELPNYGVFDERRYFAPGDNGPLVKIGGAVIGVTVCEDIWTGAKITERQAAAGANLLVNLSSSPYRLGAREERLDLVKSLAKRAGAPLAYCNLVGGQDELVFDGGSFIAGPDGEMIAQAGFFREQTLIADIELEQKQEPSTEAIELTPAGREKIEIAHATPFEPANEEEEVWEAVMLGARDYVEKNRFQAVVIALSGGIDSAITAAVAADALGPDRVKTVYMPSPYSSDHSRDDAKMLAENLGVEMMTLPIAGIMNGYGDTLKETFEGRSPDITEENIQARIRGALIMALSNKFGWLVLTTGNKSEIAVGYCTLYGDTVGGFSVIKDIYKTRVYRLCRWRNEKAGSPLIPQNIIDKAPSAELRPDQFDTDSLPPYDQLDPILAAYIEDDKNIDEIEKLGYSRPLVQRVVGLVDKSEYKRRQGPIGVKITPKAFGRDRRHPITCRYKDG